MPFSSPNARTYVALIGILVTIVSAAVGYGVLKAEVATNRERINVIEHAVEVRSTDPSQTPVGQRLLLGIEDLQRRMARMEAQLEQLQGEVRRGGYR